MIIDNIGMLSSIYQYGKIAYIGGGFGAGIHNTLEPIAFSLPVIFGPKYQKFEEARQLVISGGGLSINNSEEFEDAMTKWSQPKAYNQASAKAQEYIQKNSGATEKIYAFLKEKFSILLNLNS